MYDYVIVGAGSAGCVLAARLTEDPTTQVLLVEAGPPDDADEIHIPAAINLLFKSAYDWDYQTVPQERACSRRIYWPRGRTLGGSSSINAMIYMRGNRYDYDTWRDEYGCTGWGYADLLPYFLRSEDNSRGASAYHGAGGPLSVEDLRHKSALTAAFVDAAKVFGLPPNNDFNAQRQDGVGFYQVTQKKGRRWSAADAYLRPAMARPNLTVQADALVTRIVFEGDRAAGVRYLLRGSEEFVRAEREVILAAGAVGSPQLLMLSGVGPADHLRDHDIDIVADSPGVGGNLSDHPIVTAMWHTPKTRALWEQGGPVNLTRWQLTHRGPLRHEHRRGRRVQPERSIAPGTRPPVARPADAVREARSRRSGQAGPVRADHPGRREAAGEGSGCAAAIHGTSPTSTLPTFPPPRTSLRWSRASGWPGRSPPAGRCPRYAKVNSRPVATCAPRTSSVSSSAVISARCTTRSARVPWAGTPAWRPAGSPAWSTPNCASAASKACGWWTPP